MAKELSDSQLRNLRIKRQSQNPFGANFSSEVRSPRNLRLVPNSKGNELHHNRIVDVFAPFFVGNKAEDLATVDHLAQRGIYIGNNDKNLTAVPSEHHQTGDDSIHRFAIENNIQANLKGMQNSPSMDGSSGYEYIKNVGEQISKLPFEERIKALDIFVDQIQPALDEKMESLGYSQPSRKQGILDWTNQVNAEHNNIVAKYLAKKDAGIDPAAEEFKQGYLNKLIASIRN